MVIEAGERDLVPIVLELRSAGEARALCLDTEGETYETLCFRTVLVTKDPPCAGRLVELETDRQAAENADSVAGLVLDLSQIAPAPGTYPFEVQLRTYSESGTLLFHRTVEFCDRNVLVIRKEVSQ